jgi:hypothetical protein
MPTDGEGLPCKCLLPTRVSPPSSSTTAYILGQGLAIDLPSYIATGYGPCAQDITLDTRMSPSQDICHLFTTTHAKPLSYSMADKCWRTSRAWT